MENNFDNYFKEKLETRKFEMKPEYWEGAEALIEADQRGKGWRRLLMWFVGVLLLGVVIFGVWKKTSGETSAVALDKENATMENTVLEKENNQLGKNFDEPNDVSKNEYGTPNEVVKNGFSNNVNPNNGKNDEADKNGNGLTEALGENNSESNFESTASNLDLKNEQSGNPNSSFFNPNLNPKTSDGFSNKNSSDSFSENNNKTFTNDENVTELVFPKIENPLNAPNAKFENPLLENSKADDVKTETEIIKPIAEASPFIPSVGLFLDGKKLEDLDLECAYLGEDKKDKWMFGATAGVVGYPLIENSSTQPFIGAKGGFVVERNFKNKKRKWKWTIGSELLYHFRSGNFIASKKNENLRYSFGRTTTVDELTPKNLHYLELPIYAKYHWKKVNFEAGGSLNYLMGVRGEVNQNGEVEKGWTPTTGFKKYHANVLLGIHYHLSENIRFGLRANYTPNGILEKTNASEKILRESGPLYVTFKVTQFLNREQ